MANRKRGVSKKGADERELEILFPFVDVELQSGEKVVVSQWDIDTGAVLSARVVSMMQKLQGRTGDVELDELIRLAKDECFEIVATTVGWTVEKLRTKATWEDFLDLLQAVIDTSLIREDGSGALPKIVKLAGALVPLAGAAARANIQPSQAPSTSSSGPATPSPISGE